jgi:hypothetical protein
MIAIATNMNINGCIVTMYRMFVSMGAMVSGT